MASQVGELIKVSVQSSLPRADAEWNVDLGNDLEAALIYTNLAYDLVAAAMAKLGVEMSKYILDGDYDRLETEMACVQQSLRAGVAGVKKKK
jgi:hypothetical protein